MSVGVTDAAQRVTIITYLGSPIAQSRQLEGDAFMTAFTINGRIMGCARRQFSRG